MRYLYLEVIYRGFMGLELQDMLVLEYLETIGENLNMIKNLIDGVDIEM